MVAHGLEHDIAAQGDTVEEAIDAWQDVLVAQVLVDLQANREPLSGVGPADERYFAAFKRAKRLEHEVFRFPDDVPAPWQFASPELRVA